MKPVESRLLRKDCTRDNRATRLPNVAFMGFNLQKAKRGNWIAYSESGSIHMARVIGGVECEGKRYIEACAILGCFDNPCSRWIDPDSVIRCLQEPPFEIFRFLSGEWAEPADIIDRMERGFLPDSYYKANGKPIPD
jgi:hypothetical protein